MDAAKADIARQCVAAAESGSMTFPQIVGLLIQHGFESYVVDFRRSKATYYLADGDSVEQSTHATGPVAPAFDATAIQAAIREAQQLVPGYTYLGFCQKVTAAGCAGYMVSFSGRRAMYFGRTGETHTEHFPD